MQLPRAGSSPAAIWTQELLQDIRAFGRIPKEVRGSSEAQLQERHLAEKLRKAKYAGLLSAAEEFELAEIKASELGGLAEAEAPPDPLDPFADDAANRLEQDLLMFSNGIQPRELQRRLRRYQRYVGDPALQSRPEVQKYREQLQLTCASAAGRASYVAGQDIQGDALRTFACTPEACGPLTCQLCDADFLYDADFGVHKDQAHGGEIEYRKRVLFLMDDVGCRPITAQEKRVMVQNFSHFQQFSRPGAKGNTFARVAEVPRCEAACALCQQKDFIEHRHKLALFSTPPSNAASTFSGNLAQLAAVAADAEEPTCGAFEPVAGGASQPALLRHGDVHYLQAPERVHALLDVERYSKRWPLIPAEELHASSVQHPGHPEWRWLLHSRRVPVARSDAIQLARNPDTTDIRPPCAGIGDEHSVVLTCWDCLVDIGAKNPKLPIHACANDNWLGRERLHVREASQATKMLASLGRCCWKQVRLGRQGDPALQEKALTGNTIFFAQPTADVPSLELPPPRDALVDSLNIIFTRSLHDLSKAEWATVKRADYMRIVRERKQQCPAFANVVIREDEAATRLPADGIPEHIACCAQEVHGSENAPARLTGPASRAPDVGKAEGAGDESDAGDDSDDASEEPDSGNAHGAPQPACSEPAEAQQDVPEASIAVDPVHDVHPVQMMRALQANIASVQSQAAQIIRNEKEVKVQDCDGALQPVVDEGGRDKLKPLILDLQATARGLDQGAEAAVERVIAEADLRLDVCPTALAIPTQEPLDSFNARTYPACYVEWWFGDGAPGLDRERPMLFEQVARRLINLEEHEYSLASDQEPYKAARQSRFNNPEIIAVLGDVLRRLRLLKGTRAAIGRKGFSADLRTIASATAEDFMEAMNIGGPKETLGLACANPMMPATVKTALRSLLLSTSDVPGTEGRKAKLRFDGHGSNLLFGGPSFFATPNFADTYNPLVKLLHDGPAEDTHLVAGRTGRAVESGGGAAQPASQPSPTPQDQPGGGYLADAEPTMPSLRSMHETVAADPRAQAKFFLLMSELHYRYIIGIERLHIGRATLAKPLRPVHDEVASSLQPCVTPGTTDLQAPLEAQGRGFTHAHGKGHSMLGPTLRWLRRAVASGLTTAARRMRQTLLSTAGSVQYESAREAGRQLGVDLRSEPFTARQQRQSRMDGGEDEDGTLREHVDFAPPVEQPHVERERCAAAATARLPRTGAEAYRELPLTGAFQSTFPVYRQRGSFGLLGDATQLTVLEGPRAADPSASRAPRALRELYALDDQGVICEILNPDGTAASQEDLAADAAKWAAHFAQDSFNNHCVNHEHDCTATCIKYAKKKLEAKESLRSHKVPSCRFWYFRLKRINGKMRRRRGKPLVETPFIADTDDRNQEFRCQVRREQPFRSTSNDVAQVTDRCNVDFQFLFCAPPAPPDDEGLSGAAQPAAQAKAGDASRPLKRRRLRAKTGGVQLLRAFGPPSGQRPAWFTGTARLTQTERMCIRGFAASFQKAAAMDFYITKYQGKPMEALTPLFRAMTDGIHRLERQEAQEEEEAEAARKEAEAPQQDGAIQPVRKQRKTLEALTRRARRVTIRLASMANRCFWLSPAELVVHILTDGDCLQSHDNTRIFTRQLQWALQQCKRLLNHDAVEEAPASSHQAMQAVAFQGARAEAAASDVEDTEDEFEKVEACTASTNTADDYAHRGRQLGSMPFYVYRMYVRRVRRPGRERAKAPNLFLFEPHYALASTYAQEVVLQRINVPTIDGFQCPTVEQDAEQNALLKALLFTPWSCTNAHKCGCVSNFSHFLCNAGTAAERAAHLRRGDADDAPQLVGAPSPHGAPSPPRKYSFQRAWRLRHSELHVLAARADARRAASKKWLVLADTTLFAEIKEPQAEIVSGEDTKGLLQRFCRQRLQRNMCAQGARSILAFVGFPCKWHEEQCTLAEFSAYVARDVVAHIDLAAEARVNKPRRACGDADQLADSEDPDTDSDDGETRQRREVELVDIGGGADDTADGHDHDVPPEEVSRFILQDVTQAVACCLQQEDIALISTKTRKSQADLDLKDLAATYDTLLSQNFGFTATAASGGVQGYGKKHQDMVALQKKTIALAKKQAGAAEVEEDVEASADHESIASGAAQPAVPELVPLPLAMRGPAAVALKLVKDAQCTEEQMDAVALLALSLQRRFDARPDKSTVRLPVATAANNHRAVWLGGGGVGKTRTLSMVVQPLAETYFGPEGYCATAQSNHAAQNLGNRGRTLHAANGLLMADSLQTARLRCNAQTQKKLDRLAGDLGVDIIDELGCVPANLLHADALRKTYGRCLRHNLDTTKYMKPSETWGRMPVKILSGDFYQLPPVPATASLLAPNGSYEHQQGRKLLSDMEYVLDFVNMQRFQDPLLVHILEAMRTPGGQKISEEAWQALKATAIGSAGADARSGASQPDAIGSASADARLKDARGWYECAYEWRIVSYAMHAHARLNAKAAAKILFYVPAIDAPATRMPKEAFDEMRALPNIGTSAKFPGILPVFVGMEMILTESYLPPRIVRGTPVEVVDIEVHPKEPPVHGRASIASHGCVLLHYMPRCIYVRVQGCTDVFLGPAAGAAQPGGSDLQGVLAVQPTTRQWMFKGKGMQGPVSVSRTQCPLLPQKQCTLHGVQGKTADPGFIAHWKFPKGLKQESIWLAYYVSLSRPRSLSRLLSHGLPDRSIIEGGPPERITDVFKELFTEKIAATQQACAQARAEMGWPARQR